MFFKLLHTSLKSNARIGKIQTDRGIINTPVFMPVGTLGTVKGINQRELINDINAEIILSNTYHLYLRPGNKIIKGAGGLHDFINWKKPILTDSGGYQIFSLSANRKIKEKGVYFNSHIDGSKHFFSPESVIDVQNIIGSDIAMVLDECIPYPSDYSYAKKSLDITHNWLDRSIKRHSLYKKVYNKNQFLFPIVQGGVFEDLRKKSADYISEKKLFGNAIGGLSVGEPKELLYKNTDLVCQRLPVNKPRYLMGVGTPENILECISLGVDMFDCVLPTRNGRNGMLFTSEGTINIKNKKWENDFSPIDLNLKEISKSYSKAYLRHLIINKEMLGSQIASIHNLQFYMWLMNQSRIHILDDSFYLWKVEMIKKISHKI